ncbi:MAG TPA: tetratricopeptide repeat protein, partial [Actinomycetota bacterium]|nr:tetratricopeptide repeat protein [Actinomycetota bacterium]
MMSNFDTVVIDALEQSLAIDEATYGPYSEQVAADLNKLGLVLQGLGRLHEARATFERALAIHEGLLGVEHPEVATDLTNLGGVMEHLGDYEAAKECYKRAIAIDEALYGPSNPRSVADLGNLYRVLTELGEVSVDPSLLESALVAQNSEPAHPTLRQVLASLGLTPSDLSAVRNKPAPRPWKPSSSMHAANVLASLPSQTLSMPAAAAPEPQEGAEPDEPQRRAEPEPREPLELQGRAEPEPREPVEPQGRAEPTEPPEPVERQDPGASALNMDKTQPFNVLSAPDDAWGAEPSAPEPAAGPGTGSSDELDDLFFRPPSDPEPDDPADEELLAVDSGDNGGSADDGIEQLFGSVEPEEVASAPPPVPDASGEDLNNQGRLLRDLGDLAGARDLFEKALAADEAAHGPDAPSVGRDLSGLGGVRRDMGD